MPPFGSPLCQDIAMNGALKNATDADSISEGRGPAVMLDHALNKQGSKVGQAVGRDVDAVGTDESEVDLVI